MKNSEEDLTTPRGCSQERVDPLPTEKQNTRRPVSVSTSKDLNRRVRPAKMFRGGRIVMPSPRLRYEEGQNEEEEEEGSARKQEQKKDDKDKDDKTQRDGHDTNKGGRVNVREEVGKARVRNVYGKKIGDGRVNLEAMEGSSREHTIEDGKFFKVTALEEPGFRHASYAKIEECFAGLFPGCTELKITREGDLIVRTGSGDQNERMRRLNEVTVGNRKLKVITLMMTSRNSVACTIHAPSMMGLSEQELNEGLPSGILRVRRLGRNSPMLKLTLEAQERPDDVKFRDVNFKTRPYYQHTRDCTKCRRIGHVMADCEAKGHTCKMCGRVNVQKDEYESRRKGMTQLREHGCDPMSPTCLNCDAGRNMHRPCKEECPKYQREIEVMRIRNQGAVPLERTRRMVRKREEKVLEGTTNSQSSRMSWSQGSVMSGSQRSMMDVGMMEGGDVSMSGSVSEVMGECETMEGVKMRLREKEKECEMLREQGRRDRMEIERLKKAHEEALNKIELLESQCKRGRWE